MSCPITLARRACRSLFLRQRTETDSVEFSELATNFEEAQAFRATTLDRIRMYLALACKGQDQDTESTKIASHRSILEHFAPVGSAMVEHCAIGKCLFPNQWSGMARPLMPCQQSSAEL